MNDDRTYPKCEQHISVPLQPGTIAQGGQSSGRILGVEDVFLDRSLEWVYHGTNGPDVFAADGYHRFVADTYGGDDTVTGSLRADHIDAGRGQDIVAGGEGRDTCLEAEKAYACEVTSP